MGSWLEEERSCSVSCPNFYCEGREGFCKGMVVREELSVSYRYQRVDLGCRCSCESELERG